MSVIIYKEEGKIQCDMSDPQRKRKMSIETTDEEYKTKNRQLSLERLTEILNRPCFQVKLPKISTQDCMDDHRNITNHLQSASANCTIREKE